MSLLFSSLPSPAFLLTLLPNTSRNQLQLHSVLITPFSTAFSNILMHANRPPVSLKTHEVSNPKHRTEDKTPHSKSNRFFFLIYKTILFSSHEASGQGVYHSPLQEVRSPNSPRLTSNLVHSSNNKKGEEEQKQIDIEGAQCNGADVSQEG